MSDISGYETIIVPNTGHRLAVTFVPGSCLQADVFRFGLDTQIFRREGRKIQVSNGKWAKFGYYDHQIDYTNNKEDAVEWNIVETGAGSLIKDNRGRAWTFDLTKDSHRVPIILDNVREPENGLPTKLQEFHIITGIPPPPPDIQKKRLGEVPQVLEGTVDITGANKPEKREGKTPPPRLEIEEFRKDKRFFALYIQALIEVKKLPESLITSYYQISSLHGLPLILWNNAPGTGVYCQHASPLFPTWHRPYVALFEQVIQERAIKIANRYAGTDKQKWVRAAEDLRQPYWDWAKERDPSFLNIFFSTQTFDIETPEGSKHLQNPFLYYQFDSRFSKSSFPAEYQGFDRTLRHPYSRDSAESIKRRAKKKPSGSKLMLLMIPSSFKAAQKQLTQQGKKRGGRKGGTSSLEAVHDTIHNIVGFNGHFNSGLGAFDPLFFLHHSQVDRLLSLWSTLHPDVWVHENEPTGSEGSPPPALYPFRKPKDEGEDTDKWWTSAEIRSHETFNHTYPEYLDKNGGLVPNDKLKAHIRTEVDKLYGKYSIFGDEPTGETRSALSWSVRILSKRFVIDKSFSVFVFLEEYPKTIAEWRKKAVGTHDVFINYSARNQCPNCDSRAEQDIEGYVHLTSELQDLQKKKALGLSESDVVNHLKEKLYLGILKVITSLTVDQMSTEHLC
ncbi:uncharacterized protein EI90DRAFT_3021715 [Cantharellus anzutake]|uniref:uncharacterized protein n=1 Tax=Cantharellus anzutake TaxID=1750568 RepID=UPI001907BE6D|nr:uncharacterized protein EI90DRAFT_3021715 [Cantharellus anzutake]KAF8316023.1 hypothetical protein EI90DRAFT_3021715 [Cantharellus anzutake]